MYSGKHTENQEFLTYLTRWKLLPKKKHESLLHFISAKTSLFIPMMYYTVDEGSDWLYQLFENWHNLVVQCTKHTRSFLSIKDLVKSCTEAIACILQIVTYVVVEKKGEQR